MKIRLRGLGAVLLVMCAACGSSSGQSAKRTEVDYQKWGFGVTLPQPYVKHSQSGPDMLLCEIYTAKGLGYIVTLTQPAQDSLTSTAIEQTLQTASRAASDKGATRWETPLKNEKLFKGISRVISADDPLRTQMPYISELLGKDEGFLTISMAPLGDESSPILSVGVIGPRAREREIEVEGKFLANVVIFTAVRAQDSSPAPSTAPVKKPQITVKPHIKAATSPKNGTSILHPSRPVAPEASTTLPASNVAKVKKPLMGGNLRIATPKPKATSRPATPKQVRPALTKGRIELAGLVESMNPSRHSFMMLVEEVTELNWGTVKLAPARHKLVLVKKFPDSIGIGTRVLVSGTNLGIGKPIHADWLEVEAGVK